MQAHKSVSEDAVIHSHPGRRVSTVDSRCIVTPSEDLENLTRVTVDCKVRVLVKWL
jgi:hypothetical protein